MVTYQDILIIDWVATQQEETHKVLDGSIYVDDADLISLETIIAWENSMLDIKHQD